MMSAKSGDVRFPLPVFQTNSESAFLTEWGFTGLKVAGPTGRFKRALLKKVVGAGGEEMLGDEDVRRVLRQCLWQWGYELNQSEFRRAMAGDG
jgi:hypothetical protein